MFVNHRALLLKSNLDVELMVVGCKEIGHPTPHDTQEANLQAYGLTLATALPLIGGIKILNQGAKRALEIPKRGLQGAKSGDGEGYNSQMRTTCSLDQNARNSVKAGNSMKEGLNAWAQRVLTSKSTTAGLCANPEVKYNKSGEVEKTNEADRMYIKRISWGESDSKDSK
ncbi:hypothetical protein K435DRAFT_800411 [Dendrothele bispora CBS 962.96]|uniref:Uncharacterized protein n=1 Tax=Dendrothele bispora (strain CBS 962.96) TaxID=1314807 RepID=A0A4S8LSQ4_DENBC|nr:hypothetical protein K435DRAFT_800411 [Dendrothele bispora CBS 962.96]